jgi:hypothetical protein
MERPFQALAEQIASVPPQVAAATSDADDQALRRRPQPGAWCAIGPHLGQLRAALGTT